MTDLYRLVYTSKNLMGGTESEAVAEVAQILEASQRNNMRVGVTGALMFNAGAFAQVLEGPRRAVEATFERIQRDARHTDVTVLQCGPADQGAFAGWSMAFVGQSAAGLALWHDIAVHSGFDVGRMDGDRVFSMLHALVLDEEGLSVDTTTLFRPTAPKRESVSPSLGLDVERVRAELAQQPMQFPLNTTPEAVGRSKKLPSPSVRGTGGGRGSKTAIALAVFRAALSDERKRTLELRNVLDDVQVALAESEERAERMTAERDLWASRAQLLASALGQEAGQAIRSEKPDKWADTIPTNASQKRVSLPVA